MRNQRLTYDVVVIGAGLSGMTAAAAARRQGARVAVLADGHGMLELSSGCIDLLGVTPAGEAVANPWEALDTLPPDHPYRLVGSQRVREGLRAFQLITEQAEIPYRPAAAERNQWIATALGRLRPTYLLPPGVTSPEPGQPVWVVGLQGLTDFQPAVIAEGLRHQLPDTPVLSLWAEIPAGSGSHPVQIAAFLDQPAHRDGLARALGAHRASGPAPGLVLLPAVLGLERSAELLAALAQATGAPVSEVPLLSPSVPGLRLARGLRRCLERSEIDLFLGLQVTGARVANGRVEAVETRTAAGPLSIEVGAVVLAAGGLLGRGIQVEGRTLVEPLFGLTVTQPEAAWAHPDMLAAAGQPFARCGVETDSTLRPAGYENLFLAGRMLAGYDPYAQGSGGGVAIATGWYAGSLAGGAAR